MTASWIVQRLGKHHDRDQFDSGNLRLNEWLKQRAGQFDRRDLARTYVATQPQGHVVLGYYAVSSHAVRYEALPGDQAKGLPHIDVPVVLLGRLAVLSADRRPAPRSAPCGARGREGRRG